MRIEIMTPNINASTTSGQLVQIRNYLYQFSEQLKWAFNTIESNTLSQSTSADDALQAQQTEETETGDTITNFNQIKSLIIKSADIVNAYYEQINARLAGEYVAESDFGIYREETEQKIEANSSAIEQTFNNIQTIVSDIDAIRTDILNANAYIRSGILYYAENGTPIYGLEIGQKNVVNGQEIFNKFARFTSDRLSFYDRNDTEVAYISDYSLFITNAHITGTMILGGYRIDTANGVAFKWIGRT